MQRSNVLSILALAALSATATATFAQNLVNPEDSNYATQSQAAPIQRSAIDDNYAGGSPGGQPPVITSSRPAQGVLLRIDRNSSVETVSADANHVELRLERGRANVSVHDPAHDTLVLVDLPGGQTQLLKNGLYTFNAETNTVRVLKGEASAFPGTSTKPIKVKEDHQIAFSGTDIRSVDVGPYQARADLLPGAYGNQARPGYGEGFYGGGPYGDGYGYGNPYYAYGYPYGYGYPYAYGYPFGYGLGFGYYGGFGYGGGFRGGFGGFRGGGRR